MLLCRTTGVSYASTTNIGRVEPFNFVGVDSKIPTSKTYVPDFSYCLLL